MVVSSRMEGGANVVIEAVTSQVPVLASAIPGNIGLLGRDYAGYFPAGDAGALARLIAQARDDAQFLALLARQCAIRAPLFAPKRERTEVIKLLHSCFEKHQGPR
jgi:glycosyltransferase involved in cell wall biosynthesis